MNFKKHVLKNGLRVVLIPMEDAQTVTVEILVEAGSKYENRRNNGISHFLEHMIFKGTKKRPNTKIITELLDNVGGEYNAFTGKELTGYWVKVPSSRFELALDVVSDMYLNSLLDRSEIEREKGVILQELSMVKDTPMRYVWDIFEELLYGDQPAGWDIIGTKETISNMKRKDFSEYLAKMYNPKSTIVVIAGNFKQEKALEIIDGSFGKISSKKRKQAKKKTIERQRTPKIRVFEKDTDQTHLLLGFRGPHMFSPDRHIAIILGTVLGGGMSSRAFINIRERHGLTYYIRAATDMMTDTGYVFMSAGVNHENLEKAIRLILNEFNKLKNKPVSKRELKKAKEYLKGRTIMSLEASSEVATFFGEQELYKKKIESPEKLFKKIEKVTASDIKKLANKIFVDSNLNLAVIGPHSDQKKLRNVLTVKNK